MHRPAFGQMPEGKPLPPAPDLLCLPLLSSLSSCTLLHSHLGSFKLWSVPPQLSNAVLFLGSTSTLSCQSSPREKGNTNMRLKLYVSLLLRIHHPLLSVVKCPVWEHSQVPVNPSRLKDKFWVLFWILFFFQAVIFHVCLSFWLYLAIHNFLIC